MSVNGGNQNHNLFTLNGSMFTHFNQTTGFNPPPPDAIQEIRIQTHNFSAEYGHTAGSQVSIVTKAGTNTFHGTAWEFHRNSALNARSYFLKLAGTRKPEQKQNQAGASAGGAIIRNKLFWFGSYQRLWDRSEAGSSQTIVPTDAQRAGDFTALSTPLRNSGQSDHERALYRQLGCAVRRRATSSDPVASAPFQETAGPVRAGVGERHDHHVVAGAAGPRGVHRPGRLPFLRQQSAQRPLLRRPKRQLLVARKS